MTAVKEAFHGSDLEKVEAVYGIPKEKIVSFAANVNPLGISGKMKRELAEHLDVVTSYPDREYKALRETIADYTGTSAERVLVGNGSTELISLFIRTEHPVKAVILGPTYSEYEREIALSGGESTYFPLPEDNDFILNVDTFCEALAEDTDLVVLCNPNNPTSTALSTGEIEKILLSCGKKGIFVSIDETYAEFADDLAGITAIPLCEKYDNLIVLRGTSKFFACPGIRLGYAICGNAELREAMRSSQNPWSLNSLADLAGQSMMTDTEYQKKTWELIDSERRRMTAVLRAWESVKVYPARANFIFMRILREDVTAGDLFVHCIKKGLMIRDCSTFPFLGDRYVRFCVMLPADNDRLLAAMAELLCPEESDTQAASSDGAVTG